MNTFTPISADELRKNTAETTARLNAADLARVAPIYTEWVKDAHAKVLEHSTTKLHTYLHILVPTQLRFVPGQTELCVNAIQTMFPGTTVSYDGAFSMVYVAW